MLRGRWIGLVLVVWGAAGATACSQQPSGEVVARIGEDVITVEDFLASLEQLPPQWKARAKTPSGRKQVLEHQIRSELIAVEARARGLDQRPEVKSQIDQAVQRILLQELTQEWQKEFSLPEEELRKYYEENQSRFQVPEQYRVQHILIKVPANAEDSQDRAARERAQEAKRRIDRGEAFEAVAKDVSEDPSASAGGDLGYVAKGQHHPTFTEAALNLKPGEVSSPIRTPFGWHIIKLIDVKAAEQKTFEEAREEIQRQLLPRKRQEAFESFMASLREKHKVEIYEQKLAAIELPNDTGSPQPAPKP